MATELEDWAISLRDRMTPALKWLDNLSDVEAKHLRDELRNYAPVASGSLRDSIEVEGSDIEMLFYGRTINFGGTIQARNLGWMTIPLRGYKQGPGYVTVHPKSRPHLGYVFRRSDGELMANRRREVTIRGQRWMERALTSHLLKADQRLIDEAEDIFSG